jgi:hypothetical protein
VDWTLIGFMQRAVTVAGDDYFWEEYLLYQPRLGFRWLTRSDDHWNWVEALPPGSVSAEGKYASYAGKTYALFQKAKARVVFVVGEFYWKVTAGEKVASKDFVNAPEMLSEEVTREEAEGEINWSRAWYLPPGEVERRFGLKEKLPLPTTVGPNQPFPHSRVYRLALWLFAAALLLGVLIWAVSPRHKVFEQAFTFDKLPANERSRKVLVDEPLELHSHENLEVMLAARGPAWVFVEGEIVPDAKAPVPGEAKRAPPSSARRKFTILASGTRTARVYLSAVPAGRYALRLDARWAGADTADGKAELRVEQGVAHLSPLVYALLLLGAFPFVVALYQAYWEAHRWQDSNVK